MLVDVGDPKISIAFGVMPHLHFEPRRGLLVLFNALAFKDVPAIAGVAKGDIVIPPNRIVKSHGRDGF